MGKVITDEAKIDELLSRNVEEVIERDHLRSALLSGKPLRIKFGIDPTAPKIHIGRAITFWKLKEFQDLGHQLVLIIGDFTAQIGDPSDKLNKRPMLSSQQIAENLKGYLEQIGTIVDLKNTEVHYNSEWIEKMNIREISELAELFTAQQMLRRRNFSDRWEKDEEISLREFMYPLMQGYDSVAVKADVELGGADQLFNLLAGRKIQEHHGQQPQDIVTMKMLIGTDGRKMSTSWGNVINIIDSPEEQYGKMMSVRDELIENYFELTTDTPLSEIKKYQDELKAGKNPKEVKQILAHKLVARYHGEKAAEKAAEEFERVFVNKETPEDIPEISVSGNISLLDLVVQTGVVESKSEARRLIEQGAVEIAGEVKKDQKETVSFEGGEVLKIGKRHFFSIKLSG